MPMGVFADARHPLAVLFRDHRAAEERLQAVLQDAAGGGDPLAGFGRFAAYMESELEGHLRREEEALFPVLERYLGREGGPVGVMLLEHEELRRGTRSLREAVAAGEVQAARRAAEAVASLLAEHIHKEDHVLFPLAMHLLTKEEKRDVAARLGAGEAATGG